MYGSIHSLGYLTCSLVPRPSTPPVFDRLQCAKMAPPFLHTAKTGGVEGLGMRLLTRCLLGTLFSHSLRDIF